jgi:arylsulfatase
VPAYLGGIRNAMTITWPKRIAARGGLRSQFGHVNDIAPTILEAAGIAAPDIVNGVKQKPMNGVSLVYSFDDAKAPERHTTQYFEVFGHRAVYHKGWMASAFHTRLPWQALSMKAKPFTEDTWELYDLRSDFTQAVDLAAKEPARLAEMKALFDEEAKANDVLPLSNQRIPNGLPNLAAGLTHASYHMGVVALPEKAVPNMFGRSWSLGAQLDLVEGSQGVVATIGGKSAGWSLHVDAQRRPVFTYRLFDIKTVTLTGQPLAPGANSLTLDFALDKRAGTLGAPATLVLSANGAEVARDTLPISPWAMFSINETFDVGLDTGSAGGNYAPGAPIGNPWRGGGTIREVTIDLR